MSCSNNLKQIGLAAQNFHNTHGTLPPPKVLSLGGGLVSKGSDDYGDLYTQLGSTLVLLLPFLEESALYEEYDIAKPIHDPVNLPFTAGGLPIYTCPSMALPRPMPVSECGERLGPGSYLISSRVNYMPYTQLNGAFTAPPTTWGARYDCGFRRILDGTSHTLLIGETNFALSKYVWDSGCSYDGSPRWGDQTWAHGYWAEGWGHMSGSAPSFFNNPSQFRHPDGRRIYRSDHPGGVQFVFVDGSVRFLPDDSDPEVRKALVTRNGGESTHAF